MARMIVSLHSATRFTTWWTLFSWIYASREVTTSGKHISYNALSSIYLINLMHYVQKNKPKEDKGGLYSKVQRDDTREGYILLSVVYPISCYNLFDSTSYSTLMAFMIIPCTIKGFSYYYRDRWLLSPYAVHRAIFAPYVKRYTYNSLG